MKRIIFFVPMLVMLAVHVYAQGPDPQTLVRDSFNYMRGKASVSQVKMTVHRPDWERVSTIQAWTLGEKNGLFFITAPAKDKGNGTLKKGREMWTYNPKINRAVKLPPSMMSQAWQGSDFSNNDLAKSDTLINDYAHSLEEVIEQDGKKIYVIRSTPKPEAPVVWGMLRLKIREDLILLGEEFYDEDQVLVKALTTGDIRMMGGRLFPMLWRMQKAETTDEYTLLEYESVEFKESLPESMFSVSKLKNLGR